MALTGQELLDYACTQFENRAYDAALEAFILAYTKGYEKEWVLENIYSCYMAGNEAEFQKKYEHWNTCGKPEYESLTLDFIPYREGEYYIYDKEIENFRGLFSMDSVKNVVRQADLQQMEFSALAVTMNWDWNNQPEILAEAGYHKIYTVCEDMNRCASFFKIPELEEYAKNIMLFSDMGRLQCYFHEHTSVYLPKMCIGTEEEKNMLLDFINREHKYRLTPEGRNTDNVLLTIAIPTWHRGNCVLRRLENLLSMIYDAEIEITISKNGTGVEEEEYKRVGQTDDARLLYYDHGRDLIYWENWLYAAGMAHGRYVLFVSDEDDVVLGALEHYFRLLTDYPKLNVVRAKTAFQYGDISERSYGEEGLTAFKNFFLKQNYMSGLIFRREDFIGEDFVGLGRFSENAFYESYPHEWWSAVLGQKGDNLMEPVVLIQEKDGVPQNASEVVINGYATYEGRLQQFRGMVDFLHWMMGNNAEGVVAGLDMAIRKTIYLLGLARGYGYDIEHYEEWLDKFCRMAIDAVDIFDLSEEQKLTILQTLQYICIGALNEYQA